MDFQGIIGEQREAFEPAELLCVFLVPSLTGSELTKFAAKGEQSFVQNAVESADSSVVVPHTTRSGSLRDVLDKAAPIISYDELKVRQVTRRSGFLVYMYLYLTWTDIHSGVHC